jgi:hypothetical protein
MIIFALNTPYIVNVTEVVNSNPAIIPASLQPVSSPTGAGGGGEFANPMNVAHMCQLTYMRLCLRGLNLYLIQVV